MSKVGAKPIYADPVREVLRANPGVLWTAPALRWRLQVAEINLSYKQVSNLVRYLYGIHELERVSAGRYRFRERPPGG